MFVLVPWRASGKRIYAKSAGESNSFCHVPARSLSALDWLLLWGVGWRRKVYRLKSGGGANMERMGLDKDISPSDETIPIGAERTVVAPRFDQKSIQSAQPAVPLARPKAA